MAMNPKLKKLAKWVGYPTFFLFCFSLFAYWTFPYGRLRDYLIQRVETRDTPGGPQPSGWQLEIGGLEPSWVTGVELTGVRLIKLPEEPDERPTDIAIPTATARVGLLAALGGDLSVTFDADVAGGNIQGSYAESADAIDLQAEIEGVRMRRISILRSFFSLPIKGELNGSVDLAIAEEAAQTEGEIDLRLTGATVGDGNAKLKFGEMREGVTVEEIAVGTLAIAGEVREGVLELSRLQGRGDDIDVDGAGSIRLHRRLLNSRLDVLVRLGFKESYRERNSRTQAMFSLLDLDPRLRAAKTPDGEAIQLRVTGAGPTINARAAGREPSPRAAE